MILMVEVYLCTDHQGWTPIWVMEIGSLHTGMLMSVIKNSFLFQTFMREDAGGLQKMLSLKFHLGCLTWCGSFMVKHLE